MVGKLLPRKPGSSRRDSAHHQRHSSNSAHQSSGRPHFSIGVAFTSSPLTIPIHFLRFALMFAIAGSFVIGVFHDPALSAPLAHFETLIA